jgi:hypothetical protein
MKTIVDRFFILIVTLLGVMNAFAAPSPPMPGAKRPPPPPGLPIDENILFLLIIAIVFGIYIICKHQLKTKAPI